MLCRVKKIKEKRRKEKKKRKGKEKKREEKITPFGLEDCGQE